MERRKGRDAGVVSVQVCCRVGREGHKNILALSKEVSMVW